MSGQNLIALAQAGLIEGKTVEIYSTPTGWLRISGVDDGSEIATCTPSGSDEERVHVRVGLIEAVRVTVPWSGGVTVI